MRPRKKDMIPESYICSYVSIEILLPKMIRIFPIRLIYYS
jgi:hypothetical protein